MAKFTEKTVTALNAFVARDDGSDAASLSDLLEGVVLAGAADRLLPAIFGIMERNPGADLGMPGPLVHTIETLPVPQFEPALRSSVQRQPVLLNVWMVSRILNSKLTPGHRAELVALLKSAAANPRASPATREMAERTLQNQATRQAR
jgi:hypothetical protein